MSTPNGPRVRIMRGLVRGALTTLAKVPEKTFVNLVHRMLNKTCGDEAEAWLRQMLRLGRRMYPRFCANSRRKIADNFVTNAMILGTARRVEVSRERGVMPPFFFVVSPTMACNLRCYGCYAGNYTKHQGLDLKVLDRIFNEAKELGIYFLTISGGEPFLRQDLLDLFAKHDDMFFQTYTNGTLIDPTRLAELGNVFPAISCEGFRKETDARRGPGTFDKVMEVMDGLREQGVPFGFSATATSQNVPLISSDEFIDFYAEKGCVLGWYFTYVPIGRQPNVDLMPTPEQRHYLRRRVRELRGRERLMLGDFWNDGMLAGGCLAGGRYYFHINSEGDVEPCVFVHFAVDNVRDKPLVEAINSDFFRAIRNRQPYDENLLRPCMIVDCPQVLREVVRETGARPTHEGAETVINELADFLDRYAEEYGRLADRALAEEYAPRQGKARESWEAVSIREGRGHSLEETAGARPSCKP